MRNYSRVLFSMMALVAILSSCKNKSFNEAKLIPKDAVVVLAIDPSEIQDKLNKSNFKLDTILKAAFKGNTADSIKITQNVEKLKSALDFQQKVFFFMTKKGDAKTGITNSINILATLKDDKALESLIANEEKFKTKKITKGDKYSYVPVDEHTALSWSDKFAILTFYSEENKMQGLDTAFQKMDMPDPANKTFSLKATVESYYHLAEAESMSSLPIFMNLFKEKNDLYCFTSSNSALGMLSLMPLQLPKLQELVKDNYTTFTVNFKEGNVEAKSAFYPNPWLGAILKKYAGPTVNLSMLDNYPSKNIDAVMLASFNPEIFGGLLKQLEVDGLIDGLLQKQDITSADFYKCLKGDIAVIVSDFSLEKSPNTNNGNLTLPKVKGKMLLNALIGDKVSFHKIMDKVIEQTGNIYITKSKDGYKGGSLLQMGGFFLLADNDRILLASDSLTYSEYVSGKFKGNIGNNITSLVQGKSTATYIDVANILKGVSGKDSAAEQTKKFFGYSFKDIIASNDNFNGTSINSSILVRMQNDKQNSLVSIMNMADSIHHNYKPKNPGLGNINLTDEVTDVISSLAR